MVRQLILTGFMGAGKTTIGKLLANKMELPFIDIDKEIEIEQEKSIREIFDTYGEEAFRKMERGKLAELRDTSAVLSTGGGIVLDDNNQAFLIRHPAPVFYLRTSPKIFLHRLRNDTTRPLLQAKTSEEITAIFESRTPLYEQTANYVIITDNKDPYEIADEILAKLK
ncbi:MULTISPECIES: shikimate kinase [Listeria]|uniref:shikimate kinase n=1 Tax=Listeria TaxID=1637 RepID=UPI000B591059|nr:MULTISPECIES: shikimate kinase [Listeria]